jgi:hypothetical protein
MSYALSGWVKQRVCGRWAKVEMPLKPHYCCQWHFIAIVKAYNSHQYPTSAPVHRDGPVRTTLGRERDVLHVSDRELEGPVTLCSATTCFLHPQSS